MTDAGTVADADRPETVADLLDEVAAWLDTYDDMCLVFVRLLRAESSIDVDNLDAAQSVADGKSVQNDVRALADWFRHVTNADRAAMLWIETPPGGTVDSAR